MTIFKIGIVQTRKIEAENWEDAGFMALMWSIDEKADGYSVEEIPNE